MMELLKIQACAMSLSELKVSDVTMKDDLMNGQVNLAIRNLTGDLTLVNYLAIDYHQSW